MRWLIDTLQRSNPLGIYVVDGVYLFNKIKLNELNIFSTIPTAVEIIPGCDYSLRNNSLKKVTLIEPV